MFSEKEIKLSEIEIAKSAEDYRAAEILFQNQVYSSALNRLYYSIFHLICARLDLDGLGFSKHSAVVAKFRELYLNKDFDSNIKTKLSNIIKEAEDLRNKSDYEKGFYADEDTTRKTFEDVTFFRGTVLEYINNLIKTRGGTS